MSITSAAALTSAATIEQVEGLLELCTALGMRDVDDDSPHVYRKGIECHGTSNSFATVLAIRGAQCG